MSHVASNHIPFVPGNRLDRFDKALNSGADAIILDLEDAVDPAAKDAARERSAPGWAAAVTPRAPGADPDQRRHDAPVRRRLRPARPFPLGGRRPARRNGRTRSRHCPKGRDRGALIETARGLRAVDEIAAADGVQRLAFGTLDFAADLDLSGDERGLIPPAMMIALASRCAEKAAPIAGVTPAIDDIDA